MRIQEVSIFALIPGPGLPSNYQTQGSVPIFQQFHMLHVLYHLTHRDLKIAVSSDVLCLLLACVARLIFNSVDGTNTFL
jgi:hypothetical protein